MDIDLYKYIWDTPISVALKECAYFLLKSAANNDGMLYMHEYVYMYIYIYMYGHKFMYEYIWDTPISVALKECAYIFSY
jgi:hypothetical protein